MHCNGKVYTEKKIANLNKNDYTVGNLPQDDKSEIFTKIRIIFTQFFFLV